MQDVRCSSHMNALMRKHVMEHLPHVIKKLHYNKKCALINHGLGAILHIWTCAVTKILLVQTLLCKSNSCRLLSCLFVYRFD